MLLDICLDYTTSIVVAFYKKSLVGKVDEALKG